MQYALLIYGDERAWANASEEEQRAAYARHEAFLAMLRERDAVVGGAQLDSSWKGATVRKPGGEAEGLVTDGPFAEMAEQLAGFYLVRARDLDEAVELARALPSPGGAVEVRPLVG
jgi:hypothetical protein